MFASIKRLCVGWALLWAFVAVVPARADDCMNMAGYYQNDGGTCTLCELGYYCPGDNARHYCGDNAGAPYYADERGLAACKECPKVPDEYMDGVIEYWYWISNNLPDNYIHTTRSSCRATWERPVPNGSIMQFSCSYGVAGYTATGENDTKCVIRSIDCDAGYYIDPSNPAISRFSSSQSWWANSYIDMAQTEFCVPAGVGYYSPDKSKDRTACPDGTSTHTDTATSADACVPLCANGGKKLHAGDHEFNIWPNGTCSHPSIGIGLPNGTCCVNLAPGAGTGINVEWDGNVYHTVN